LSFCPQGHPSNQNATKTLVARRQVRAVFPVALSKKAAVSDEIPDGDRDDFRAHMQNVYRVQQGRWTRETLAVIDDSMFWLVLHISVRHHRPLDNVMAYANKYSLSRMGQDRTSAVVLSLVFHLATGPSNNFNQASDEVSKGYLSPFPFASGRAGRGPLPEGLDPALPQGRFDNAR
jgi:hypothetical protein